MTMATGTEVEANVAPEEEPKLGPGPGLAALLAAMIGLLTMALVNLGTEISKGFGTFVWDVGKAWVPGAAGIGPYSGKETFLLIGWLVSWVVLHFALRSRKDLDVRLWVGIFLVGMLAATLLLWPPIYGAIAEAF